jgi:hypothetical protein
MCRTVFYPAWHDYMTGAYGHVSASCRDCNVSVHVPYPKAFLATGLATLAAFLFTAVFAGKLDFFLQGACFVVIHYFSLRFALALLHSDLTDD